MDCLNLVGSEEDGATILFLGVVRNHNEGLAVKGVQYEAYEEMAKMVLEEITGEAQKEYGTERIAVVHRTGDLIIGDISVAVAVSSHHREEAFAASRYIMEEIKKRLPVWKKEAYAGGGKDWVEGMTPGPSLATETTQ
tara:strand:+ start:6963 stop:7376 length:414 start_codon:yes stop_codon:yes gene_type:complete